MRLTGHFGIIVNENAENENAGSVNDTKSAIASTE